MKGTWQGSGTWQTGGGGLYALAEAAALVALPAAAAAAIAAVIAEVITAALWTAAVVTVLTGTGWLATRRRRAARRAEVTGRWAAARAAIEAQDHARRLEIARASAPQISIDPAAIAAALVTRHHAAWPQDPARVIRGEVER